MAYDSQFGGISAVNPQAKGNYQQYIDAAFQNAKGRLDPIFGDQRNAYDQKMQNMGIPIGGEAYNRSFQQMDQNQNDAYSNAAFNAMGFGLGAQAQDFGQDLSRSQLANSLLQAQWNDQTNRFNIDVNRDLGYARLGEDARQFDTNTGYNYDMLGQRGYEFDQNLANRQYEFDSGQDFNYWDRGNQFDFARDRASADDYRWAAGQDRQDYYDARSADQFDIGLMLQMLGMGNAPGVYTQDPTGAYGQQLGSFNNQYGANMQFLASLFGG